MKRLKIMVGALLICIAILTSNVTAAGFVATITNFKLFLNGNKVDKEIVVINGSSYLPVRAISEALGLEVEWDGDTDTIKLTGSASGNETVSGNEAVLKETLDMMQNENVRLKEQIENLQGKSVSSELSAKENIAINTNVTGKWVTKSGTVLQLKQDGNKVTGSQIFNNEYDSTQWPLPVEGTIKDNVLTLALKFDNTALFKKVHELPEKIWGLEGVMEKAHDLLVFTVSPTELEGKLQYAKMWWGSFVSLAGYLENKKLENGGSELNTNEWISPIEFTRSENTNLSSSESLKNEVDNSDLSTTPAIPTASNFKDNSNGTTELTLESKDGGRIYYRVDGKDPKELRSDYISSGENLTAAPFNGEGLKARVYKNGQWSGLLSLDKFALMHGGC